MKSNGTHHRSAVGLPQTVGTGAHRRIAGGSPFCRSPRRTYEANGDSQPQHLGLGMEQYQQPADRLPRTSPARGHSHPEQRQGPLHVVAKPKLMPRFTRLQVLRIIKLATMDKLRGDSAASGADDPTRQRLATEAGAGGAGGGAGGEADSRGAGAGAGTGGGSDEFHHQFYNTGRIGRRNALPDILGTHCTTSTADLSSQLGALSTSECTVKPADGSSIVPPGSGQTPTTTTTGT